MKADTMNEKTIELPPLPERYRGSQTDVNGYPLRLFSAPQMHGYARAAIIADRASRSRAASEPGEVASDLGPVYVPDDQGPEDVRYVREDRALAAIAAARASAPQPASSPVAAEGQKVVAWRTALADALEFIEFYSRAWNGVSAKHPNTIATNARAVLATPTASMADAAEAADDWVAYVNKEGFLIERETGIPLAEGCKLYLHPSPAPDRGLRIAEMGDDRG